MQLAFADNAADVRDLVQVENGLFRVDFLIAKTYCLACSHLFDDVYADCCGRLCQGNIGDSYLLLHAFWPDKFNIGHGLKLVELLHVRLQIRGRAEIDRPLEHLAVFQKLKLRLAFVGCIGKNALKFINDQRPVVKATLGAQHVNDMPKRVVSDHNLRGFPVLGTVVKVSAYTLVELLDVLVSSFLLGFFRLVGVCRQSVICQVSVIPYTGVLLALAFEQGASGGT